MPSDYNSNLSLSVHTPVGIVPHGKNARWQPLACWGNSFGRLSAVPILSEGEDMRHIAIGIHQQRKQHCSSDCRRRRRRNRRRPRSWRAQKV
jgi:hypothetical protein